MGMGIITLTTDFGTDDWFVGTMKGVIASTSQKAMVVDISHAIASGDIRAGAFALAASYKYFPRGTVHVAIVDPGVGSNRRAIAVQTERYFFVGPDNGVLSFALHGEKIKAVRALENETYFLRPVSQTFHGRDVFAPVAAHLARGLAIAKLGHVATNFVRLDWAELKRRGESIEGEVIYVDKFGNTITNIPAASITSHRRQQLDVFKGRTRMCALATHYQAVPKGQAVAVPGSSGYLEIAVNGGDASAILGLGVGDRVAVRSVTSRSVEERVRAGRKGK
jgi:S-adenosyl-L-methionine hydrolase (adenosine-forming)